MGLSQVGSQIGLRVESAIRSRMRRRAQPGGAMNRVMAVSAALGSGAALMYLFDPNRGASRRATIRDGFIHAMNKTGSAMGATSRDLSNRARGLAAQAGSIFEAATPMIRRSPRVCAPGWAAPSRIRMRLKSQRGTVT